MSKNSAKQMYTQVMEWLPTVKQSRRKTANVGGTQPTSRLDYYKSRNA